MAINQEELDALDPETRKLYDQVSALARERGIDTEDAEFWENFAQNIGPVATQLMDHVKTKGRVEQRMGRK